MYIIIIFYGQAFDLQGEINLTKCYEVSEYQVLKNYGFQIHVRRPDPPSVCKGAVLITASYRYT